MLEVGAVAWVNSRAPASLQSLSEVSALVFIFRKEIACEQALLRVTRVSGEVRVSERGVWCIKEVSLPWSLISVVLRVSLSSYQEWERGTVGTRLNFAAHACDSKVSRLTDYFFPEDENQCRDFWEGLEANWSSWIYPGHCTDFQHLFAEMKT